MPSLLLLVVAWKENTEDGCLLNLDDVVINYIPCLFLLFVAVTCYADHDHNPFGFQGVLVFVCVGVVLVILVYICIRISTLPSPLFQ